MSLLFNWPSTGGGTVHTAETGKFLAEAGYDVRHFYAEFKEWGLGSVTEPSLAPSEALQFTSSEWSITSITARFRRAVDTFQPDWVIVTDSWNSKPILAEAMVGYRYLLRIAAQECLCPLNNVRLLCSNGQFSSCPKHQFASPDDCCRCVFVNGKFSGGLHQAERELVAYGTPIYDQSLRRAFAGAEAVLVVNPLIGAMIGPYAKRVCVIPSGFDSARFPPPTLHSRESGEPIRILFAGLVNEPMKGFGVLYQACGSLWKRRQDFELVVTADPPDELAPFARFVGWQSQSALPEVIRAADIVVVPTIAEEALGRTAVEAMGAGRPVIASRIGGLQFTVADGGTGLLFEPGDAEDLERQLELLLNDSEYRMQLGRAGRRRFDSEYTWEAILNKHYLPLLGPPIQGHVAPEAPPHSARATTHEPVVVLGCVLAVQNRPAVVLERTFQTYAFQSLAAHDRVLLDYGSCRERALEYQQLCRRYKWRLVRAEIRNSEWSLSAAYNLAVSKLVPEVNVVFKGDVDVLLGENVLQTAATFGREQLCIFSCQTTVEGVVYPAYLPNHQTFAEWQKRTDLLEMDGEGIHAYPRGWFESIGGFDQQFGTTWGYEDSDLRLRATWSIGVNRPMGQLLVHQWHSRSMPEESIKKNQDYYFSTKDRKEIKRNGGQLFSPNVALTEVPVVDCNSVPKSIRGEKVIRIVVATRSLVQELSSLSGEFLAREVQTSDKTYRFERHLIQGAEACSYFRELLQFDADWIVSLDEDAFLLDPIELCRTIEFMDRCGYAACGMPDGGVVPIRQHNPAACNGFFNIFDMRRVRPIWQDFDVASRSPFRSDFTEFIPEFARRSFAQFDNFEPYYGLFFALLNRQERLLYLDADECCDGISTLLRSPSGAPFLLHAWYAREWYHCPATRERMRRLGENARQYRKRMLAMAPNSPDYFLSLDAIANQICLGAAT